MLTCWLPRDVPSPLPPNASHQVGVGAFVVNEKREVLVVQERLGPLRGKGVWKLPTGPMKGDAGAEERQGWGEDVLQTFHAL